MIVKPVKPLIQEHSLLVSRYFATVVEETDDKYKISFAFNIKRDDITQLKINQLKLKFRKANYREIVKNFTKKNVSLKKSTSALTAGINNLQTAKIIAEGNIIDDQIIDLEDLEKNYQRPRKLVPLILKSISNLPTSFTELDNTLTPRDKNLEIIKTRVDPAEAITDVAYKNDKYVNSLLNHYLVYSIAPLPVDDYYYSTIETNVANNVLYLHRVVDIPIEYAKEDIEVIFEVSNTNNKKVYKERKAIFNIKNLISYRKLKIIKPSIVDTSNRLGLQGLTISQHDKLAKAIRLEKKVINTLGVISNYSIITSKENFLRTANSFFVPVANSESEIEIYRCITYNSKKTSNVSAYKNIIVGTIPHIDTTTLLISNNLQEKAVQIDIRNIPHEADEFQVLKRKILKNANGSEEPTESSTGYIVLIDFTLTKPSPPTILDKNVETEELYEYKIKYKFNGIEKQSAFKVHKFIDASNAKPVEVTLTVPEIEKSGNDVTVSFNITSQFLTEPNNVILETLIDSKIDVLYKEEFSKIKQNLQDLLFYKITRINLSVSPAIEEEFKDILKDGPFKDDKNTRKNSQISDINLNYDYLYQVRGFYKNPVSLLRDLIVRVPSSTSTATGNVALKGYSYKPYKWLQKKVQNTGTLPATTVTGDNLETSFLEDGDLGVLATVKIDKLEKLLEIKTATANRLDMITISIDWTIENELENYDHFVVVKHSNKNIKILTTTKDLRYVDTITRDDAGSNIYYITPVYNNYEVGPTIRTNTIIVDPEELDGTLDQPHVELKRIFSPSRNFSESNTRSRAPVRRI